MSGYQPCLYIGQHFPTLGSKVRFQNSHFNTKMMFKGAECWQLLPTSVGKEGHSASPRGAQHSIKSACLGNGKVAGLAAETRGFAIGCEDTSQKIKEMVGIQNEKCD